MKWKKIIGWVAAGIVAVLLVVVVGGLLFLKTSHFQNCALRKITEQARASTGAATEIRGLDFSLSTLTAHLYNITMHGAEAPNQAPLLQVDKLTVSFKIQSVLHRKVALRELLIEHPVVHMETDRTGKNNLPQAPSQSQSQTNIFDVGIERLRLTNGELNYKNKKMPLEADFYNLGTGVRFDPLKKRYSGTLSYVDGRLHYADYGTMPHKLNVKFNATADRFTLESVVLKVGASKMVVHAGISSYSNPVADGDYEVRIHAQDFAGMASSARPAGDVLVTGKLHHQFLGKERLLRNVSTTGQIASEVFSAAASGATVQVRKLHGRYQLGNGTFRMSDIRLETLGGTITSDLEIQHLDATSSSRVRASLRGISLRAAQQTLHRPELKGTAVSGALNGTVEASWKGSMSDVRARADLMVRAAASSTSNRSGSGIPVDGVIHGTYDGPRNSLTLRDTALRIPSATLTAQGEVSDHSNGVLVNAHKGQASFDARVGLQNWSYQPSSPIRANLSVQRMQVADLQRLANQHYPVSGELSGKMSVQGSQLDPDFQHDGTDGRRASLHWGLTRVST